MLSESHLLCAWVAENTASQQKFSWKISAAAVHFSCHFSCIVLDIQRAKWWFTLRTHEINLIFSVILYSRKWDFKLDLLRWSNFTAFLGNSSRKSQGIHELRVNFREWMQSRLLWILNSIMRSEISFDARPIIFMIVSYQRTASPTPQRDIRTDFVQQHQQNATKHRNWVIQILVLIYAFSFYPNDFT